MRTPAEVRLRSCVTLEKGKPPAAQPYYGPDADRYLTPEYLRTGGECALAKAAPRSARVEDGDTILLWDGSNAGEVLWGRAGILASTMSRASHAGRFDDAYFFYALKQWEPYLKGQTSGSGIPHIDKEILSNLAIIEFDLREQTKIAEVLSTMDRAIKQTEALIAKQQRIKTGLIQDLLARGIDRHGSLRSEQAHEFKDSPLGSIPVQWECVSFGDCWRARPQNGLYKPQSQYSNDGTPIVRIDGFRNGDLIGSQTFRRVRLGPAESRTFALQAGDLLVNRVNSIEWLGKAALVGSLTETTVFESNMMRIRVDQQRMVSEFALLLLSSPHAYHHFRLCAKTAIAQASINQEDARSLLFAMPHRVEQQRIVDAVQAAHRVEGRLRDATFKLRLLRTGLMHDLLTRNRRVTVLLERSGGVTT